MGWRGVPAAHGFSILAFGCHGCGCRLGNNHFGHIWAHRECPGAVYGAAGESWGESWGVPGRCLGEPWKCPGDPWGGPGVPWAVFGAAWMSPGLARVPDLCKNGLATALQTHTSTRVGGMRRQPLKSAALFAYGQLHRRVGTPCKATPLLTNTCTPSLLVHCFFADACFSKGASDFSH